MSGHLDGPPPGPPDPPYIPGDLGAPSAKEFARRRAGDRHMSDNPYPNASDTMHYELHTAWDEGYAEGFAAGRAAATPDPQAVIDWLRSDAGEACRNLLVDGAIDEFARERAAATPDPPDAADLVAAHLRERWPCTCRPGMDGGGVYHAADCNSRREGSQAVLAVIRLLRAATPPASPDERLREALTRIERLVARWDAPIRHDVDDRVAYEKWAAVGSEAHKIAADALAAADREAPDDWRCECGDLNRGAEAFCFRCGACPHDDEPKETT